MQPTKSSSLTERTAEALRQRITNGQFQSGERLPTEKAMADEFGVSRTVVREAVAGLRADGLIKARHGVGVFVAAKDDRHFGNGACNPFAAASILDVLELRMATEVHAAGLAAVRRSWSQQDRIWNFADQMRRAAEEAKPTEALDLAFHRAIAEAANNPAFVILFDQLGQAAIPSNSLVSRIETQRITERYLTRCYSEHFVIYNAIANNDVEGARAAMRAHLVVSQERFRDIDDPTSKISEPPTDVE